MLFISKAKKKMYFAFPRRAQFLKEEKIVQEGKKVALTALSIYWRREGTLLCVTPNTRFGIRDVDLTPCFFSQHGQREITKGKARKFLHGSWTSRVNQRPTKKASAQHLERVRHLRKLSHNDTYTQEVLAERSPASSVEHSWIYASAPLWSMAISLLAIQSPWLPYWVRPLIFKTQPAKLLPASFW